MTNEHGNYGKYTCTFLYISTVFAAFPFVTHVYGSAVYDMARALWLALHVRFIKSHSWLATRNEIVERKSRDATDEFTGDANQFIEQSIQLYYKRSLTQGRAYKNGERNTKKFDVLKPYEFDAL